MLYNKYLRTFYLVSMFFLANASHASGQIWNPDHSIGAVGGQYNFAYNQTPAQLIELYPAGIPNTGFTYQWYSNPSPVGIFTAIPGATLSSYSPPTLMASSVTTYYYRKTMSATLGSINSNTVKISVVSTGWEDVNYIREHDVLKTGQTSWTMIDQLPIGSKLQTTNYIDGLGRSVEKVSKQTSTPPSGTTWGDMVQFSQYDQYGRQPTKYLPYTTTNQPGKYKTAPLTDQPAYYANAATYNETSAFSTTTFDNSPLNRVSNMKEPGASWAASAGTSAAYDMNATADNVQIWTTDYTQGHAPVNKGAYAVNTLYKLTYTDVNGNQVVEFTNKSGQLVLKKIQAVATPTDAYTGWICTYSVYDDFGLLRFQIQPEGVKWLYANSWNFAATNGSTVLAEQVFQYNYDDKGRTIWKKAPGASALTMVYDVRDRMVFMQDGNQAAMTTPQWTANLYDDLDRPLATTLLNTTEALSAMQSDVASAPAYTSVSVTLAANTGGTTVPLNISLCPASINATTLNSATSTVVQKYIFYDNYSFSGAKAFNTTYTNTTAYNPASDASIIPIAKSLRTWSMATGSLVRVLGSTSTFLGSTSFYDEKGHQIQTIQDNIKSGTDITTLQYYFDSRVMSSSNTHTNTSAGYSSFNTLNKYIFDNIGRVTSIQKTVGGNAAVTVATYDYDDIGREKTKHLSPGYTNATTGLAELESLNYSFNIHNQITGINRDYALKTSGTYNKWGHYFGMDLGYDKTDNIFTAGAKQLNGQVGGIAWNTMGDDAQRKYEYSYDNAGRLAKAAFTQQQHPGDGWSGSTMDFSVNGTSGQVTYDLNGNLLTMLQKGVMPGQSAPITIDDLRYNYKSFSNKLDYVTDQMTATSFNGLFGDVKDGTNGAGTSDYVYDNDGNVVIDLNKNAQSLNGGAAGTPGVHYNYLDKPDQIRIVGKGTISIVYDANGEKLQRAFIPETGGSSTINTYINQYIYQESSTTLTTSTLPPFAGTAPHLSYMNFEEGRIRAMTATSTNNGFDQTSEAGNLTLPAAPAGGYSSGAWDYFVMDYQQNVRMILTEETHAVLNDCTMETARATAEDPVFGQTGAGNEVEVTRYAKPSAWTGNTTAQAVRLGNLAGHNLGPNTLQKVMAGDQVSASVTYYYQSATGGDNTGIVTNVVSNLLSLIGNGSSTAGTLTHGAATNITSQLSANTNFTAALQPAGSGGTTPKAFLTILFFDERFNFISSADGGVAQSQVASSVTATGASLTQNLIKAPKNGYAYIYLSNRSDQDVYFDNFIVSVSAGNIIEENHYYAFGLKIASISSHKLQDVNEGKTSNPYQYNDKEMLDEDAGLNWYDYGFRNYDPQIGRFAQVDPLTDAYPTLTPFQIAGCDPIANVDIDGLEVGGAIGGAASAVRDFSYASSTVTDAAAYTTPIFRAVSATSKATKFLGVGGTITTIVVQSAIMGIKMINNKLNTSPVGTELPAVIGRSNNRMHQEDSKEGDGDPSTFGKHGEYYAQSGDLVALNAMRYLIDNGTRFADGQMTMVANQMYEQFKSKQGGDFHSAALDNEIKNDDRYKQFIQAFKAKFEGVLAENCGNIQALIDQPINIQGIVPVFGDNTTGLGITVDAINYTCIVLKKFEISPSGKYVASIQVQMYDAFGLDTKDVKNFGSRNVFKKIAFKLGFVAWWMLQHVKGYKHLDTKIYNNETFSGTISR